MATPTRLGSYELGSELGRGANGVVYRAVDTRLRREVALKVMPPAADRADQEAFQREARAAARLRHPGIVHLYDAEVIDGSRVVVLELVDGGSLARKLKREGPLPSREAARIVKELANAVDAAHVQGIVHRDLKPANVLLEKDGRPRLTDFGLARDDRANAISRSGDVVGTPAYMAPEQASGDASHVGPWTDTWGLGAVLYECLAGGPPFPAKTVNEVLARVIHDRLPPIDAVRAQRGLEPLPKDLVTICTKALEKERDRRYTTAGALEEDLQRWLDGRPILARPASAWRSVADGARRNAVPIGLGLAVALAGFAAFAIVPRSLDRSRRRAHYETVLANVGNGEGRFSREKAVFELTKENDGVATPLLIAALEGVTARMAAVTREQLLAVTRPLTEEERVRQAPFERLAAALDRFEKAAPDERIEPELVRAIDEARRRVALRSSGKTALLFLAGEHRRRVGEEDLLRALVAVEALGHLGRIEALDALGRHLHVAEDEERGIATAHALGRLRSARAAQCVLRVDERHARGGSFGERVMHALALELGGVVPPFEPRVARDFVDRGRLRALLDDRPGAMEDFTRAVSLDAKDAYIWGARASMLCIKHDWAAACTDLEHAMALEPEKAGHLASHAYTLCERKELDRALAECDRAIALDPADARSWSTRGFVKMKKKDRAGSLADLSRAIELDPGYADPFANRASLREEEDPAGAIEDDTRALALDPTSAAIWNNRGCSRMKTKDLDGAIADLTKAIELAPLEASQFVNRANVHVLKSDYKSAVADTTKALALEPNDARALCVRGRARIYLDDQEGASADLLRASAIAPGDKGVWNALSLFHFWRGDMKAALAAVDRQVELAPEDPDALTSRGLMRSKAGDLVGAREDCVKATELRPLDPTVWDNLAEVLVAMRDWKPALEASERALRTGTHYAAAWRRNATIKHWLGDLQGALKDATRAVEINGQDWANFIVRAELYRQLGDLEAALKDYRAALALCGPKELENKKAMQARIEELERAGR